MNKEAQHEALNNAVRSTGIADLVVHYKFEHDGRKKIPKFFLMLGSTSISPVLDYDKMNHFIWGMITSIKYGIGTVAKVG